MPKRSDIKKVLVIGSGPIVIGQAAEFDYAGAQACRVMKSEGVNVVLCNSNPATIMTDKALADEIYLEPLTEESLKRIIIKEKPDSLLASLGGQTGLTMGCKLAKSGFLAKHGVKLIGTKLDAIDRSEDRELFKETMEKIHQPCVPSDIAYTVEECVAIANKLGYPVIIRPAYTLGGAGGGVAYNEEELRLISHNGLMLSPITQVLIEKYIAGWKEVEFEVLRDSAGNVLTVCSMENVDPVGVHTGDSIVVAPAVTLSNKEYSMLRGAALAIITELGIEGGCNVQFALNPDSFEYSVIEVNPRVSRSSALASKATGFPIAKVTSKIALGYTLDEIVNDVTGNTYACFEPTIDYLVVKMPKWPFDKFLYAKRELGTRMKATGEVMSIGTSFEMAMMKAVRGAEISSSTFNYKKFLHSTKEELLAKLPEMTDERIFVVYAALKKGVTVDEVFNITKIDRWFLNKFMNLIRYEERLGKEKLTRELYDEGKRLGYLDKDIAAFSGQKIPYRRKVAYKMVDTCAAEFPAKTPYFYSTFDPHEHDEAKPFVGKDGKKRIIVIGSGPIRIGQGIEFDYSSVHCVWTLKELGYEVVIINNNPETVSTDFDTADRLYFEPLTPEDVQHVLDVEKPYGVIITFGGQTAINLCSYFDSHGIRILGTSVITPLYFDVGRGDRAVINKSRKSLGKSYLLQLLYYLILMIYVSLNYHFCSVASCRNSAVSYVHVSPSGNLIALHPHSLMRLMNSDCLFLQQWQKMSRNLLKCFFIFLFVTRHKIFGNKSFYGKIVKDLICKVIQIIPSVTAKSLHFRRAGRIMAAHRLLKKIGVVKAFHNVLPEKRLA